MKTVHVSNENHALLERIRREKRKKKLDDVLGLLISEHQSLENVQLKEPAEKEDDSIKCINRIFHKGVHWCVNRPPKMVKLETLDICKVCKQRKIGLTESTKIEEKPQQDNTAWRKDPERNLAKYGMVFCPNGMWVYPSKCESCKLHDFAKWDDCQKTKQKKEAKP